MKKHSSLFFVILLIISLFGFSDCKKTQREFHKEIKYVPEKVCALVLGDDSESLKNLNNRKAYYFIEDVLSQREDLHIIDRSKIEEIKNQIATQESEWSSNEKSIEIGKALNADYIVIISLYQSQGLYKVEFLDANTFQKKTCKGKLVDSKIGNYVKVDGLRELENFFGVEKNWFSKFISWWTWWKILIVILVIIIFIKIL